MASSNDQTADDSLHELQVSQSSNEHSRTFESDDSGSGKAIEGYLYEPRNNSDFDDLLTSSPSASSGSEEEEVEGAISTPGTRGPASSWCLCGNCQEFPTIQECVCCGELSKTKAILESEKIKCIIEHPSFHAVCLNTDVLWTALVGLADRENAKIPKNKDEVKLKTWRYAAYRQFVWWVHTHPC